jgi:hypothetical protein
MKPARGMRYLNRTNVDIRRLLCPDKDSSYSHFHDGVASVVLKIKVLQACKEPLSGSVFPF